MYTVVIKYMYIKSIKLPFSNGPFYGSKSTGRQQQVKPHTIVSGCDIPGNVIKQPFDIRCASNELVIPKAWLFYQINKGSQQAPRMRSVHY